MLEDFLATYYTMTLNLADAATLKRREQYLKKLRPRTNGDVAHKMPQPLPHFRAANKSKPRAHKSASHSIRKDKSHESKPSYPAPYREPAIAMGVAVPPHGMQLGGNVAQGVLIANGAQAVGARVGKRN